MSQENVEMVRRGYEHFLATGDFLEEAVHPDFVWDMSTFRNWRERQTYAGLDGARAFVRDWREAWEDWELEVEGRLDADQSIVAVMRQRGRSKATGLPVDMHFAMLRTLRRQAGPDADVREPGRSPRSRLEAAGLRE